MTIERIALCSLIVSILALAWAIAIHIRNDLRTKRKLEKLEKRVKRHKCVPPSGA